MEYSKLSYVITKKLTKVEKNNNGIFFTPPITINKNIEFLQPYMNNIKNILEPSCGSCEFILAIDNKYKNKNIVGIEINKTIFKEIIKIQNNNIKLLNDDFLQIKFENKFDLIIGNPPYYVMKKKDIDNIYNNFFDGRPNIFILFIIKSLSLLNNNGILSFILPKIL